MKQAKWTLVDMGDLGRIVDASGVVIATEYKTGAQRIVEAHNAALDTAQPVQVNAMLVEALEEARNGLAWYQAMYPAATDGSDDEAMERIDAAIAGAEHGASNA